MPLVRDSRRKAKVKESGWHLVQLANGDEFHFSGCLPSKEDWTGGNFSGSEPSVVSSFQLAVAVCHPAINLRKAHQPFRSRSSVRSRRRVGGP